MKIFRFFSVLSLLSVIFIIAGCKKETLTEKIPVANAGPDQSIKLPQDSVVLTGTGKEDGGTIAAYLWSEVSGPNTPLIRTPGAATTVVKGLVAGTYVFQLMVVDAEGETGVDMIQISVTPLSFIAKYLYLRPGPADGKDVIIQNTAGLSTTNVNFKNIAPELSASEWTYFAVGGGEGTIRSLIKFAGLSAVPANAVVDSAFINFYGLSSYQTAPQGNSYFPGSPYNSYGDNKCWLQQVTSDWVDNVVTWNTQPSVTTDGQVEMAASTAQYNYNATHIDVTGLVKNMVATPAQNYGFMMKVQSEVLYRNMIFGSSWNTDSTKRPSLQVYYKQLQ